MCGCRLSKRKFVFIKKYHFLMQNLNSAGDEIDTCARILVSRLFNGGIGKGARKKAKRNHLGEGGDHTSRPHIHTHPHCWTKKQKTQTKAEMRENILPSSVMAAFNALRYIPLRYFALVTKINKKGKAQERVIVLTELHLYSCTKEDGSIKRCLSLADISRVMTCRNRSEVALVVIEGGGAEYDLLFQAHSPTALDEFLKHIPKEVEVRDVAMSLLGRHNGAECSLHLEKPKGYSRDVADAVKWKVSSWTTLDKSTLHSQRKQAAQQRTDATTTAQSAPPAAAAEDAGPRDIGSSSPSRTTPPESQLHAAERASVRTTASTVVGKQLESSIANRLSSLISFNDDDDDDGDNAAADEEAEEVRGDGGDVREAAEAAQGVDSPPASPIGHLIRSERRRGELLDNSLDNFSDDGMDGIGRSMDEDEDDDGSDLDVAFDRIHPTPRNPPPAVLQSQTSPGGSGPSLLESVAFSTVAQHSPSMHSPAEDATAGAHLRKNSSGGREPLPLPVPFSVSSSSPRKGAALLLREAPLPVSNIATSSVPPPTASNSHHVSSELMSLLHEERTKFASQILLTSELLSMERENSTALRRIVDELRMEIEQLTFENMILKRSSSEL